MNILDQITNSKKAEIDRNKSATGFRALESAVYFKREGISLAKRLLSQDNTGIIAEFKRKSPSKGIINDKVSLESVVKTYAAHGAAGISVLTDQEYFGGTNADLSAARDLVDIPILRKDFMIDEYQLVEAKSIGADVILLIAACLSPKKTKELAGIAINIGLEVLLEIHEEKELDHICDAAGLVGINNRDLKTFSVDIDRSLRMAEKLPVDRIKIAESGIHTKEDIDLFRKNGFRGFLIGEHFMKEQDPGDSFRKFVNGLGD